MHECGYLLYIDIREMATMPLNFKWPLALLLQSKAAILFTIIYIIAPHIRMRIAYKSKQFNVRIEFVRRSSFVRRRKIELR